ncbi:hypothetical protein [Nitrobacter sp. JJSN]|uniref:hypothetical protein n=1 Tax=Nitrobacter sp. JJSN TaxID=3453033 RepID=UPI003F7592AA
MTTKKPKKAAARKAVVIHVRIDLDGIRNGRDAQLATSNVLKAAEMGAFSAADRNYYLALIEMRWRASDRDAQIKSLEDRIAALEQRRAP